VAGMFLAAGWSLFCLLHITGTRHRDVVVILHHLLLLLLLLEHHPVSVSVSDPTTVSGTAAASLACCPCRLAMRPGGGNRSRARPPSPEMPGLVGSLQAAHTCVLCQRMKMEPHGVFREVTALCTNKDHYQSVWRCLRRGRGGTGGWQGLARRWRSPHGDPLAGMGRCPPLAGSPQGLPGS